MYPSNAGSPLSENAIEVMNNFDSSSCHLLVNPFSEDAVEPIGEIKGYGIASICDNAVYTKLQPVLLSADSYDTENTLRCVFSPQYALSLKATSGLVVILMDTGCGAIKVFDNDKEQLLNATPALEKLRDLLELYGR